ncbi:MAG: hypothetical protein CYPHOPRED_000949 [Cyphobasidiales sp. Tagirdzhanova-0007]|nr:MAG: hypothetical protein CYPHOPRED_000949 [Cyphobasidiales sp. Tagirdzhanova-0007]
MSISSVLGDLSSSCQSSLSSLLTSDFSTCADVLGLANIASASGSIVSPLNDYLIDICTSPPCTQSALSNATSTIQTGCSNDIASNALIPTALEAIINNYGDIRSLLCTRTQQTSNNFYCLTQVLDADQSSSGTPLTISALEATVNGGNYSSFFDSIPAGAFCTDCGHAISTETLKLVKDIYPSSLSTYESAFSTKCGSKAIQQTLRCFVLTSPSPPAGFIDGQIPSDISTAGATSVGSTSSGHTGGADRSRMLNGKTLTILGTLAAVMAGVGITFA